MDYQIFRLESSSVLPVFRKLSGVAQTSVPLFLKKVSKFPDLSHWILFTVCLIRRLIDMSSVVVVSFWQTPEQSLLLIYYNPRIFSVWDLWGHTIAMLIMLHKIYRFFVTQTFFGSFFGTKKIDQNYWLFTLVSWDVTVTHVKLIACIKTALPSQYNYCYIPTLAFLILLGTFQTTHLPAAFTSHGYFSLVLRTF